MDDREDLTVEDILASDDASIEPRPEQTEEIISEETPEETASISEEPIAQTEPISEEPTQAAESFFEEPNVEIMHASEIPTEEIFTAIEEPLPETEEAPQWSVDNSPTEPFIPVTDTTDPVDPLEDAQVLPSLFPEEETEEVPQESVEPTVVPRPKKKVKPLWQRIVGSVLKWLIALILAAAILVVGLFVYLTMTEYSPAYAEKAKPGSKKVTTLYDGGLLRIVTFNTGYGALGEDADFFMDGGKGVNPESKEVVTDNMIGIERILSGVDADIIFLQEVDMDSDRSFEMNQWLQYEFDLKKYESRFAMNYSCKYVPYPVGEFIGKVNSGVATYSRFDISSATRYSLPCPFSWPVRVANLKRCLLVTRLPIQGRDQELVLINFHLEAYDDGEGKAAQTEQLMNLMKEEYEKGNYVIAGGDFNQIFPGTKTFPIKDDAYWKPGKLDTLPYGWRYAYDDSVATCRLLNQPYEPKSDATQYYVIDGFIVSPNVSVNRVKTLDEGFVYSDHNPVVLDIELK